MPTDDLLNRLNGADDNGDQVYRCKLHPIQDPVIATPVWLLGSHPDQDTDRLKEELLQDKIFKALKAKHPDLQLDVFWDTIKATSDEKVDKSDRGWAVHVATQRRCRTAVLTALQQTCSPARKKKLPRHQKFIVQSNTGCPHSTANPQTKKKTAKARERQRICSSNHKALDLDGAIHNLDEPVYGGGPSLYEFMIRMQRPCLPQPLLIGVDKVPGEDNCCKVTVEKANRECAEDPLNKLGLLCTNQHGPQAWAPFTPEFKELQEADYKFENGIWKSVEDIQQELAEKAARQLKIGMECDDLSSEEEDEAEPICVIENIQVALPGSFRTKSIVPSSVASATTLGNATMGGCKCKDMSKANSMDGTLSVGQSEVAPVKPLPFPSLQDVQGFPDLSMTAHQAKQLGITAPIVTGSNHYFDVLRESNFPPSPDEFHPAFNTWLESQSVSNISDTFPEAHQSRMMWGMIVLERASAPKFFEGHQHLNFLQVLESHTVTCLCQNYPSPSELGLDDDDTQTALALPEFTPGSPTRKAFGRHFESNPMMESFLLQPLAQHVSPSGLACHQTFPVDKFQCSFEDFAMVHGRTVTPEIFKAMMMHYRELQLKSTEDFCKECGPEPSLGEVYAIQEPSTPDTTEHAEQDPTGSPPPPCRCPTRLPTGHSSRPTQGKQNGNQSELCSGAPTNGHGRCDDAPILR